MMKIDWITIAILGVLICCTLVAVQYYFNMEVRECVRNPLSYSSKYYEDKYGYPFIGSGSFAMSGQSPIILYFDAEGVTARREGVAIDFLKIKDFLNVTLYNSTTG